jgi:hypothetical protein
MRKPELCDYNLASKDFERLDQQKKKMMKRGERRQINVINTIEKYTGLLQSCVF